MRKNRFCILAAIIALSLTSGCGSSKEQAANAPAVETAQPGAQQSAVSMSDTDKINGDLFSFRLTEEGYTVTEFKLDASDMIIPAEFRGVPVTAIGDGAFVNCDRLERVVIPEGVSSIGDSVFYGCDNLVSVLIPSTVQEIGQGAFTKCVNLKSIDIPEGVTEIKLSTFYGCTGMESVTIPDTVTSIGISAFNYCDGLGSITIPDSVTSIAYRAFWECTITVNAPHDPDYYGYTPDRHVTWVTE